MPHHHPAHKLEASLLSTHFLVPHGVTHRDASSDDLPMMSMDDEPHILGYPIQTRERQLPLNLEDEGIHSDS